MAAYRLTPPQKILSAKIRWKYSRLDFLRSRRHPPHWLSSKGPKYQRGVLLISAGAIEGHFEGKPPREVTKEVLFLHDNASAHRGTCNLEETSLPGIPVSWSPTLFSGSVPVGLPPVPWTEKTIAMSPFLVRRRSQNSREDLVGRTNFWIFFEWLEKVKQRAKKCIELLGEYVE